MWLLRLSQLLFTNVLKRKSPQLVHLSFRRRDVISRAILFTDNILGVLETTSFYTTVSRSQINVKLIVIVAFQQR